MFFVVLGLLLIALKVGEVSVFTDWTWWTVLTPFALAALWWIYADMSGLTKRREMEKLEKRKLERRRKNMAALGTGHDDRKTADAAARAREAVALRVEGERTQRREHNEKVVKDSVFDSRSGVELDESQRSSKTQT